MMLLLKMRVVVKELAVLVDGAAALLEKRAAVGIRVTSRNWLVRAYADGERQSGNNFT